MFPELSKNEKSKSQLMLVHLLDIVPTDFGQLTLSQINSFVHHTLDVNLRDTVIKK